MDSNTRTTLDNLRSDDGDVRYAAYNRVFSMAPFLRPITSPPRTFTPTWSVWK
jgi:hypothetical protein